MAGNPAYANPFAPQTSQAQPFYSHGPHRPQARDYPAMSKQPSAHFGGAQEEDYQDGSEHAASQKRNKDGTLRKRKGRRTVG